VGLAQYGVACQFQFSGSGAFRPDGSVGGSKTKEDTGGCKGGIEFGSADTGLLDGDMASERFEVREVRSATREMVEQCDVAWECGVRETVFDVDSASEGT